MTIVQTNGFPKTKRSCQKSVQNANLTIGTNLIKPLKDKNMKLQNISTKNVKIAKIVLISLAFILITSLFYQGFKKLAVFLNGHKFMTYQIVKIEFHKPFAFVENAEYEKQQAIEKRIKELLPIWMESLTNPDPVFVFDDTTRTEAEMVEEYSSIFWTTIHTNESTQGKNNDPTSLHMYCRNKGMWNEIGYSPATKYCFKSEAEARAFVPRYLKRNCSEMPLSQCLCRWNKGVNKQTGKPDVTCAYSEGDLSMAN